VTHDLAAMYPEAEKGLINIGLLHTALEGREGHDRYAPCRLDALVHKGYDYWALGHVHQREVLHENPWVVFPGNLQGRHAKETGSKGATLIHVENGRIRGIEHRALDEVRFARCEVDATSASSEDQILERLRAQFEATARASEGRLFAAKVVITGATRAHAAIRADPDRFVNEVRALGLDVGGGGAWIERVVIETSPEKKAAPASRGDDPIGALLVALERTSSDAEALRELASELRDLKDKLPADLRQSPDALALDDPEAMRDLLGEVRDLLLPRLEQPSRDAESA
jgi:DNA repair exonuclease SbcCD nuclease subunit